MLPPRQGAADAHSTEAPVGPDATAEMHTGAEPSAGTPISTVSGGYCDAVCSSPRTRVAAGPARSWPLSRCDACCLSRRCFELVRARAITGGCAPVRTAKALDVSIAPAAHHVRGHLWRSDRLRPMWSTGSCRRSKNIGVACQHSACWNAQATCDRGRSQWCCGFTSLRMIWPERP